MNNTDTWTEWSKHVLLELQRLNETNQSQNEKLSILSVNTTENTISLKEHMRRTIALEENNKMLKEYLEDNTKVLQDRIDVLEKVKDRFHFLGWAIISCLGIFETLKTIGLF